MNVRAGRATEVLNGRNAMHAKVGVRRIQVRNSGRFNLDVWGVSGKTRELRDTRVMPGPMSGQVGRLKYGMR